MKTKHLPTSVIALVSALTVVAGCLIWANSAWLLTPFWAWLRLNQLRGEMASVPTIASTVLIDRVEGMSPSNTGGCATVYIDELRGSNSLSITDTIHELGTDLPAGIQRSGRIYRSGATYQWTGNILLGLSDFAIERSSMRFDEARSDAAEHTYKTLFVIGLWQPVYPDGFDNRCH